MSKWKKFKEANENGSFQLSAGNQSSYLHKLEKLLHIDVHVYRLPTLDW
jgi:hypothetical protein